MIRRIVALGAGVLALAGLLTVSGAPTAVGAPTAPPGFVFRNIPTGLSLGEFMTDFALLPDGGLISVIKAGKVYWATADGSDHRLLATLTVQTSQDLGLIGVSISPGFRTDHKLYTARAVPATGPGTGTYGKFRLSSWTVTVDADGKPTGLASERALFEASADNNAHGLTTVLPAEDGTLWVSIGDNSSYTQVDPLALRALNLDDPHGKILHLNPDGSGVVTNPYYQPGAPGSTRSKVWASGFRSPFRLSLHPVSGLPVVGDVGWNEHEEVDLVQRGGSYGWPCWEGSFHTPGYRELPGCAGVSSNMPIYDYPRSLGNSVTGGVIYTGTSYPEQYRGAYFFADFAANVMWTMTFDDQGRLTRAPENPPFSADMGGPIKFATTPNGDILYGSLHNGVVRRLVWEPGNNAPTADLQTTQDPATRTVSFDGTGSTDPNGDTLTYSWDFGDGTTGTGPTPRHTYPANPESFTARLTVTDPLGATGSAQLVVFPANHSPTITLNAPDPTQRFAVGDTVTASATATDAEDGSLDASLRWSMKLVHCRQLNCHDHPGEESSGPDFSTVFDGHPGDTRLVITVSATDTRGASVRRSFEALPRQVRLTVQSSQPAAFVLGDVTGATSLFTVGQQITVIAPELAVDAVSTFATWADGAPRIRTVTIGTQDLTLQASYLTPIDRRYADDTGLRTALGGPVGVEQISGNLRWRKYERGRIYWTPERGTTEVHGGIAASFEAHGADAGYGIPTTNELPTPDGRGRYNLFTGGKAIYWTAETGARTILGGIKVKWNSVGSEHGYLGYPSTDETLTPGGTGAYNDFERGASIYWSAATDAKIVRMDIRRKWYTLGAQGGFLGFPTTDETATPDGIGAFNRFQGGSIYYSNNTGSWSVRAGIEQKWRGYGAEASFLGYPMTDETATADGVGAYNLFQRGAIYYNPSTGIHELHGGIRLKWSQLGSERSYLGYPTTDEYATSTGARQDFQHGYITWDARTGAVVDHRG
jgi:glucose/arabinose dehydrogenase